MVLKLRRLALVIVPLLIWSGQATAQQPNLPPAPVPLVPSSPSIEIQPSPPASPAPGNPAPIAAPLAVPPPPYSPYAPYQGSNTPLLRGDLLLDRPSSPPPGWFAAFELNLVGPHIKNRLIAPVTVDGFAPDLVHLPTAELEWTGSPRLELGYRFPQGFGEVVASYRFLISEGSATLFGFDLDGGDAFLRSRLNANVVDLDYGSREFSLLPHWEMKARVGVRLANVFFDSRAEGFFLEQRTSNFFFGAGPHVGLDLWRALDVPGLGVFARLEAASVIGQVRQAFEETLVADDGTLIGGATEVHHTQDVPSFGFQIGLSWTPCWHRHWGRYAFGYEFEQWWNIGEAGASRADLTSQGLFFRAEWSF